MPESKKRDSQKHAPMDFIPHKKKRNTAVPVTVIFCVLMAMGIAWFAAGSSVPWLIGGGIAGAIFGYFLGKQMDKSLDKPRK